MSLPGGSELVVILLIFVLLFGARKLPDLGSSVGKSITNFKRGLSESKSEDDDVTPVGPGDTQAASTQSSHDR